MGAFDSFKKAGAEFGKALEPLYKGDNPDATLSGALNKSAEDASATAQSDAAPLKVLGSDDQSYSVQHPDGSTYQIAKAGLDPQHVDMLEGLKQAQPTNVAMGNEPGPASIPSEVAPKKVPFGPPGSPASVNSKGPVDPLDAALSQQRAGILGEVKAQEQLGKDQAAAYKDYDQKAQQEQARFDKSVADNEAETKRLRTDIEAGKVDPNHFWANQSTGAKISASLGLLFSGIGSGAAHQSNMAEDVIKDAINADIKAQMENLSTKKTLLSENLKATGDIRQAHLQTLSQMLTGVEVKVKVALANAQGPLAKAAGQKALAAINVEQAQIRQKNALLKAQLDSKTGGVDIGTENPMNRLDKEYNAGRVVVGGKAYQANTPKEAEDLRNMTAKAEPVRNIIGRLDALGASALIPGTKEAQEADSLRSQLVPAVNELKGINRISEQDVELIQKMAKNPSSFKQFLRGGVRNQLLIKNIEETLESEYKNKLGGYEGSLKSQGKVKPGFGK